MSRSYSVGSRNMFDMGVGGQRHAPAALPPGRARHPLYKRLGGPQCRSPVRVKVSVIEPSFAIKRRNG